MSEGRCVSAGGKGSGCGARGSRAGGALLLALACLMCTSCAGERRDGAIQKLAEDQYSRLSRNDAELRDYSGLSQVKLFGRCFWNTSKYEKSPKAGNTYTVRVPFWCEGIDGNGQVVRKRCQLRLSGVRVTPSGKAFTEEPPTWDDQGPLTFTRQFWTWVGVVLMGAMFPSFSTGIGNSKGEFVLRFIIAWILLLPLAGYAAKECFGSWSAVTVCLVTLAPPYVWATARIMGSAWAGKAGGVIGMVVVWAIFLTGGGWLLWKVVPYVARGTMGWFQWLFGHF